MRFSSLRSGRDRKTAARSAIDTSRTSGCSMRLSQPTKRVTSRRGMRLVSRKLMSSCCNDFQNLRSNRHIPENPLRYTAIRWNRCPRPSPSMRPAPPRPRPRWSSSNRGSNCRAPSTARSTGHARMSRLFAALVPFYEYDEGRFFRADDAPADVAEQRRAGFFRLAALYRERFPETIRQTVEVAGAISDLQFTDAYRVPFQFSRFVRDASAEPAPSCNRRSGVTVTDLDGNALLRPHRLLRRQPVRLRLLQGVHGARRRARARSRTGARRLSSGRSPTT